MSERPYFEKLEVWQLAHAITLEVYRLTRKFPADERFRLVDQLCRAAASVPANIAEGEGRQQAADQIHFVHMARASLSETRYFLVLARDLDFLGQDEESRLNELGAKLHSKLNAFIASKRRLAGTASSEPGARSPSGVSRSKFQVSTNPEPGTRNLKRSSISGFTLIELMTVMSIIIILAGLVVGISSYANRSAIESRTKAEIKAMETALESYKADYGAYPPLDQDVWNNNIAAKGGITNVFSSAVSVPTSANDSNTNGWLNINYVWRAISGMNTPKAYMSFTAKQLKAITNSSGYSYTVILDPNGNPYGYNPINPSGNPQTYDLWSAGVDGKSSYPALTSTNDDIGNWQR